MTFPPPSLTQPINQPNQRTNERTSNRPIDPSWPFGAGKRRPRACLSNLEMIMSIAPDGPKQVGNIEMEVRFAPPTPENQEKFDRRAEALAAWLLAQWERQQQAKEVAA